MTETTPARTLTTVSGRTRTLPATLDPARVAGLDQAGRIVVDDNDARNAAPRVLAGRPEQPFMFGLTLCCDAYDKGTDLGVVCRNCYGDTDTGAYLFRAADGSFPGLDPVESVS